MNFQSTKSLRPQGFKERADCTVKATSIVAGISYKSSHQLLTLLGRRYRKGFVYRRVAEYFGMEERPELSCHHFKTILPQLQKGRFVVKISRHVFAVVDGVVHDWREPKSKCRVRMVYEFPKKS